MSIRSVKENKRIKECYLLEYLETLKLQAILCSLFERIIIDIVQRMNNTHFFEKNNNLLNKN